MLFLLMTEEAKSGSVSFFMLVAQKLPRDFQIFVIAVVVAAAILLWVLLPSIRWDRWPELLLFALLITVASMLPIPNPRGGYFTSTGTLMLVLLSVQPPGAVLLVAGSAYAIGHAISQRWVPWRTIFNGAQLGISATLASLVFYLAGGNPQRPGVQSFLLPFLLASLVHQISNNFFISSFVARMRGTPPLAAWFVDVRDALLKNLLGVPASAAFSIFYVSVHPATLFLFLPLLPVQRWATELYIQQKQIFNQAIDSLVVAIEANFPQGAGHSRRVASISAAVARLMRLPDLEVEAIGLGALVHDVGMIGLDEILESRDGRNASLADRLREHVTIGAEVAKGFPRREVSEIILYHHENYDGSGYPRGFRGGQIPLSARIVAIAEMFDSMVSGGFPYPEGISPREAIRAVRAQAGRALDPHVVDAFLAADKAGELKSLEDSSGNQ